MSQDVPYNK